jgi:serine/threonine-protein kinase RsbW
MVLTIALQLPRDPMTVPITRQAVDCALIAIGVADECRRDVVLALTEACANVVQHAGDVDEYTVRVTVNAEGTQCTIDVANAGRGSDPESLYRPLPDAAAEHGRGLHIIRMVMDGAEIMAGPAGGLAIHMIKRLVWRRRLNGRN